jgi:hypothetical protein
VIAEALRSLIATWRIMRHDLTGFDELNLTLDGFWRSFTAVILILPMLWLVSQSMDQAISGDPDGQRESAGLAWAMVQVLLNWAAWPIIAGILARALKLGGNYVRFIVAYNWMAVILAVFLSLPHLLHLLGLTSFALTGLASFFIFGVSLYYSWYLARVALGAPAGAAVTFAVADFALSAGLSQLIH